jgi:ADP-heptose:LPS heptosyltransferase
VIKLGALGDLVLCMSSFAAIRAHHPKAEIALLTAPAFAGFAMQMPWFDHVITDSRPKFYQFVAWFKLLRAVRNYAPSRVYDLQGKTRQTVLYYLLGGARKKVEWSGAIKGCSHPRAWPPQPNMHYTDFLAAQMERAEVKMVKAVDLSWLETSVRDFDLGPRYALLIPGCAPSRPYKRWPAERYAELAQLAMKKGLRVAAIGTKSDAQSIADIRALAPEVIDLSGKTSLKQVASLARGAEFVVGNDTGPTHLAAAVGARTIALMSDQVDPYWSCPRGSQTRWLQGSPLAKLSVERVMDCLK